MWIYNSHILLLKFSDSIQHLIHEGDFLDFTGIGANHNF
jgi:hypothetical protein